MRMRAGPGKSWPRRAVPRSGCSLVPARIWMLACCSHMSQCRQRSHATDDVCWSIYLNLKLDQTLHVDLLVVEQDIQWNSMKVKCSNSWNVLSLKTRSWRCNLWSSLLQSSLAEREAVARYFESDLVVDWRSFSQALPALLATRGQEPGRRRRSHPHVVEQCCCLTSLQRGRAVVSLQRLHGPVRDVAIITLAGAPPAESFVMQVARMKWFV